MNTTNPPSDREFLPHQPFPVFSQLLLLSMVLLALFGNSYLPKPAPPPSELPTLLAIADPQTAPTITALRLPDHLPLTAEAVYVWDGLTKQALYSKNPDTPVPLASITKLMTALVATELVTGDTPVPISMSAIRQDGNSGLRDGEQFALSILQDYALVASSNDAAYALAEAVGSVLTTTDPSQAFVAAMNIRAEEMGLVNTHFKNPTGLDISPTEPGAIGSARDVTFLMDYLIEHHPDLLAPTREPSERLYNENGQYHDAENTNLIATDIPNLIGSKTGYTDLAGGNLVVAYHAGLNRPIIITVLGSTRSGRFVDVMTIVDAITKSLAQTS